MEDDLATSGRVELFVLDEMPTLTFGACAECEVPIELGGLTSLVVTVLHCEWWLASEDELIDVSLASGRTDDKWTEVEGAVVVVVIG